MVQTFYISTVDYGPIYFSLLSFSMVADKYQILKDQLLSSEYIFFESFFHPELTYVNRPKNFGQALEVKSHTLWYFFNPSVHSKTSISQAIWFYSL